eukprot:gb/GFBE01031633.1/.p1 GENE.gb/GFBE01031633.1/~~gb/GFBE01031633.1/.p1  ORF type:complete len:156 (+),score=34.51 gb/GFBE01031633.1/:1-468(+)
MATPQRPRRVSKGEGFQTLVSVDEQTPAKAPKKRCSLLENEVLSTEETKAQPMAAPSSAKEPVAGDDVVQLVIEYIAEEPMLRLDGELYRVADMSALMQVEQQEARNPEKQRRPRPCVSIAEFKKRRRSLVQARPDASCEVASYGASLAMEMDSQ